VSHRQVRHHWHCSRYGWHSEMSHFFDPAQKVRDEDMKKAFSVTSRWRKLMQQERLDEHL
jgi:hypothetical protein